MDPLGALLPPPPTAPQPLESDPLSIPSLDLSTPTRAVFVREFAYTLPIGYRCFEQMLEKFSDWVLYQTNQDEDSFFQSMAVQLMNGSFLAALDIQSLDSYLPPNLSISALVATTIDLLKAAKSPREILSTQTISDDWSLALRLLSIGWWTKCLASEDPASEGLKRFRSRFIEEGQSSLDHLMGEYKKLAGCVGGLHDVDLSCEALSESLGLTIHPILFREQGLKETKPKGRGPHQIYLLGGLGSSRHIDALFRPGEVPGIVLLEMEDVRRHFTPFESLFQPEDENYCSDEDARYGRPVEVESILESIPVGGRYREDLEELRGCLIQEISGDGNCLFRSIAASLMYRPEALRSVADKIQELLPKMDLTALIEETRQALQQGETPGKILYADDPLAYRWILFLRQLAVAQWKKEFSENPKSDSAEVFQASLLSWGLDPSISEYEKRMGAYNNPGDAVDETRWGGPLESFALEKALGRSICIVDLEVPHNQRRGEGLLPKDRNPDGIFLLFFSTGNEHLAHYNTLFIPEQVKEGSSETEEPLDLPGQDSVSSIA